MPSRDAERREANPLSAPLERFFDRATGFLALLAADGTLLRINRAIREASGEIVENPFGRRIWETFWYRNSPEQRSRLRDAVAEAASGRSVHTEIEYQLGNGARRWADASFHPVAGAGGEIRWVLVEGHDTTERKIAEELVHSVIDSMSGYIGVVGKDGRVVRANPSACRATGMREEDMIGRFAWELPFFESVASEPEKIRAEIATALAGRPSRRELRFRGADGSIVHADLSVIPLLDSDGEVFYVLFDARDVTDRVHSATKVRRSEARYRALFEQSKDGVFLSTLEGRVVDLNRAAQTMLGYDRDDAVGRDLSELLDNDGASQEILASVRAGRPVRSVELVRERDGREPRELDVTVGRVRAGDDDPVLLQGLLRDVTEQRRLERGLNRSLRLESIGRIAAGVGHEINNPLTWVLANLEETTAALEKADRTGGPVDAKGLAGTLREAADGARRIAAIVRDLRLLGTPEAGDLADTDLDAVLRRAFELAHGEIHGRARVVIETPGDQRVRIAEGRLLQVLLNLILNAAKAIEDRGPGDHEIRATSAATRDELRLEIADTGCGIAPGERELLFEPFFTSRVGGEGSGLGLWICERIVGAAGGRIEVSSVLGSGSRFVVVLPLAGDASPAAGTPREISTRMPPAGAGKGVRILVIDDEPVIRRLVTRALALRYEVESAGSAEEALSQIEEVPFDLILCDLTMPAMSGIDFCRTLERRAPGLGDRVAFMTGGACNSDARAFLELRDLPWLQKPFEKVALLRFVDEALARIADDGGGEPPEP